VQPRASRSAVDGVLGDAIKVRLAAAPVDDAANMALVAVLARALGVKVRAVRIVTGLSSRRKVVEVEGIDAERVWALTSVVRTS